MSARERWLGIDFSGDRLKWGPGCRTSNVWIATVEARSERLSLADLRTVQSLPGSGRPFDRLAAHLAAAEYRAAGIDAPFSVPIEHLPEGRYSALLELVDGLALDGADFPRGAAFVDAVTRASRAPLTPKPLRRTEARWRRARVNVRSTLWNGRRGGAPFTSACLKLLARSRRPIWPFAEADRAGLLAEAFPAAQLAAWRLATSRHDGNVASSDDARPVIIAALRDRLDVNDFAPVLERSRDALDAVLCAFAAIAVTRGRIPPGEVEARGKTPEATEEGWIAVHE